MYQLEAQQFEKLIQDYVTFGDFSLWKSLSMDQIICHHLNGGGL